jgi:exonuclease SbcD
MIFLHLADLHLGKRLREFSLIEDQRYILKQAVTLAEAEAVSGVFLCGDIYDSSTPAGEATGLFDDFLTSLHDAKIPVFIISGNHDSATKLQFGGRIFSQNNIYVSTNVCQATTPINFKGIHVYMLPFIRPLDVNDAFGTACKSYSEATKEVIKRMAPKAGDTNILLAHQMVMPTGQDLLAGGSESITNVRDGTIVGDAASVSSELFASFDYVALGHVHRPQTIAKNARYSGSILKYHKDEANIEKLFSLIRVEGKKITIETRPEKYLHNVVVLKGTLDEILHADADQNAYVFASLADTSIIDDPMGKLRKKYPLAAAVEYQTFGPGISFHESADIEHRSKEELFTDFFALQNGQSLDKNQQEVIHLLLGEGGKE